MYAIQTIDPIEKPEFYCPVALSATIHSVVSNNLVLAVFNEVTLPDILLCLHNPT